MKDDLASSLAAPQPDDGPLTRRNLWIDVVRGLAILGVAVVHVAQSTRDVIGDTTPSEASNILSLGRYGVTIFFFISGWLLASIYGLAPVSQLKAVGY